LASLGGIFYVYYTTGQPLGRLFFYIYTITRLFGVFNQFFLFI